MPHQNFIRANLHEKEYSVIRIRANKYDFVEADSDLNSGGWAIPYGVAPAMNDLHSSLVYEEFFGSHKKSL